EGDELVREVSRGPESPSLPEVVQRDGTPLWEATESADTVVHGDADRGEITTEAYVPLDGHGVAVVGTSDPAWLNEDAVQLIEVLTGNLLAVLDTLDREASLRASERRYRTLAENIPNGGVLTFDANLEYRLAAGEILSELGLEPSDVSGMEAGTVFPDADAGDELVPRFRAALDGERTDRRIEIGDRTIRIHVAPVDPGDGGSIDTRGLVLAQDVTEEARRERELFEERERFRLLTRSVEEYAFVTLDADGDVATWNEGAENLFGYDHERAVGTSIGQFHPTRESGLPDRLLQQARIAGESAHEGWHVRADGSEFYADVRYAKLRSDDEELPGYAMIVRDMTDRRRQQRRTERFVEESDDVVSVLDTDGTITYASGSADRVLGYDPE
ncbi:MAG: PAS domain S-box protein, partial [Halobacteriales archaeon]